MRNIPCWSLALLLVSMGSVVSLAAKPNILIFLSDDVGWAEYGFQGNRQIPTPHIDSIARSGIRFTQGYVSGPYCSPTRAGLMTGRYQTRFGHEFNTVAAQKGIAPTETTIAERFHKLGYATCAIGKWHLGNQLPYHPVKRGFDEFFGTLANTPFYHPTQFVDSRKGLEVRKIDDDTFYTTDAYAEHAVDWLGRQGSDRPWLLYVPFNAQHAPLQAPQKYLDRFADIPEERRRIFAAMMYGMDLAVGKILDKVRERGEEENTLVFFLSDNGGPTRQTTSSNLPLRGFKATTWEGGVRVPFCCQWKGALPAGKTYENPIIQLDILPTALAAAGTKADPAWKLDGVDLLPYLKGERKEAPHESLYWRFGDQWAIRHGDWKLIAGNEDRELKKGLFNLASDVSEKNDLTESNPDKARELKDLWDAWNAEQSPPSVGKEKPRQRNQNRARQQNRRRAASRAE
ncbi:MAG: sulfatase-like hydrolase/transferase [Pirellulales bacterium]|nr:sulfatase-like hydrolase/transferase [Pirellulales bacterium]